ncbi:M48 family metallopeptidase [Actinocatenispora comari]|uniref:Metal-dependent hydrolase n=1 Tax=Actinocatenispora comari TaxID=2807577 RepID=A0A8J4AD87_9ACTN|nr:M48 family metallopeptidase [Actinocatenispora comari]GIL28384.1 metal-dependent hydrolase [Actinocatenispora comari]
MTEHSGPPPGPDIEVRRSARRRSTVSAYRDGERVVVLIPARFSAREEREWVDRMVQRLERRERRTPRSDDQLLARAGGLARRYLPDHPAVAVPASVRWVGNQNGRWGSCTPADRTIRLSTRLAGMPDWVVDYVLFHELCHLVVAGHDARFWELMARYPRTERARGFLEGVSATAGLSLHDTDDEPSESLEPAPREEVG